MNYKSVEKVVVEIYVCVEKASKNNYEFVLRKYRSNSYVLKYIKGAFMVVKNY